MYRIWIEKDGFEPSEKKDIEIKNGERFEEAMVFNFDMKIPSEDIGDSAEKSLIDVRTYIYFILNLYSIFKDLAFEKHDFR